MTREYFNQIASGWDECNAEKDQVKLERLAQCLDIMPGSTVLDVGTGTGIFIPFLLKKVGCNGRLVCLDFAEEMLKRARDKKIAGHIDYICADISDSRLDSQHFEAVVCYSSFPHFRGKLECLREINRLLKPGGKLYICHSSGRDSINCIHENINVLADDLIPEKEVMLKLLGSALFKDIVIKDTLESYVVTARK
jgi:ubiquinone/menaquinone biosynthesis C-methylase UbiE